MLVVRRILMGLLVLVSINSTLGGLSPIGVQFLLAQQPAKGGEKPGTQEQQQLQKQVNLGYLNLANALRSLNQGYSITPVVGRGSVVGGSYYLPRPQQLEDKPRRYYVPAPTFVGKPRFPRTYGEVRYPLDISHLYNVRIGGNYPYRGPFLDARGRAYIDVFPRKKRTRAQEIEQLRKQIEQLQEQLKKLQGKAP